MDKNDCFTNLGIIKTFLQTLNEILQDTKISTIIYSNPSTVISTIFMSSIILRY